MLLCEIDTKVADEIDGWLGTSEIVRSLVHGELRRGDWRQAFEGSLSPGEAGIVVIEMDPMRYEHHSDEQCKRENKTVVYPEDLGIVIEAANRLATPVVIQISSFSSNNGNSHDVVQASIVNQLKSQGFALQGRVTVGGQMITFVFARGATVFDDDRNLERDFETWLGGIN